jgi:hypothetical protein
VAPVKCAGQVQAYAVYSTQGTQLATLDNKQQRVCLRQAQLLTSSRLLLLMSRLQECHINLPDTTPAPSLHPLPRPAHAPSVVESLLGPGGLGSPVAGDCAAASLALGSCMASAPGPVFRGLLPGLAVLLERGPHDGLTSQDFRVYETPEGLLSSEVVPKGVYVGEVVQSKNVRKARGRMRVRFRGRAKDWGQLPCSWMRTLMLVDRACLVQALIIYAPCLSMVLLHVPALTASQSWTVMECATSSMCAHSTPDDCYICAAVALPTDRQPCLRHT